MKDAMGTVRSSTGTIYNHAFFVDAVSNTIKCL